MRGRWGVSFGVLLSILTLSVVEVAGAARVKPHLDPWQRAVELRQKLEDLPADQRTREQFEAVLEAFRGIYHEGPTAAKAPAAVAAVADLLAEKGRVLSDPKSLRAAIGQYEFLREQYPRSPQVENAVLLEGEICRQDLKDAACAEEKFRAVMAAAPGTSFAEQASLELKEMLAESAPAKKSTARNAAVAKKAGPDVVAKDGKRSAPAKAHAEVAASDADAPPPATPLNTVAATDASAKPGLQSGPRKVVMITGMRHWSNPTSTRIAIDLGGKVEYEAARVPNPDRIFFDLHGAKLATSLNGRQVEVVDDGYLKRIRAAQFQADVTRVVLDVTDVSEYSAFLLPNPWRLIIDIHSDRGANKLNTARSRPPVSPTPQVAPPQISNPQANLQTSPQAPQQASRSLMQGAGDNTFADVAKLSNEPAKIQATAGPTSGPVSAKVPDSNSGNGIKPALPDTSVATQTTPATKGHKKGKGATPPPDVTAELAIPHAADPTSDGQRSLVRALGLKVGRIVIDAGHGGHDSGTLGPGGIQEKDVVLDVALRTGKLLHQRLGAEIVYTRDDDTFIPLETRTAIANKAQADLFLSIHANSSQEPSARGVETYYLNFTSDPNALDVAARENAVSNHSVHQLSDLVRKITLKDKIDESREFAADVDAGLFAGLKAGNSGFKDRGVKKAPFVVLIGAQMPSILAEISFLTNPDDAEQLRDPNYRQRIASSLGAGVERYLNGLSGSRRTDAVPAKSSSKAAFKPRKGAKVGDSEDPTGE